MTPKFAVLAAVLTLTGATAFAEVDASALDIDGDGKVSMEEMLAEFPELTADQFSAVDTDADGFLTVEEIEAGDAAGLLPASE